MYTILASSNQLNLTTNEIILLAILAAWELAWKGVALWKAGQNRQMVWFVVMLVLNTVGILEIVYILFFQRRKTV